MRNTQDPQAASKALVEHALSRFSTDNLSVMTVRFDNKAVQQAVEKKVEPIGVEGDPGSKTGGITEAESIVLESKKKLGDTGEEGQPIERIPTDLMEQEANAEPGPELNVEALEKAKVENKPLQSS